MLKKALVALAWATLWGSVVCPLLWPSETIQHHVLMGACFFTGWFGIDVLRWWLEDKEE